MSLKENQVRIKLSSVTLPKPRMHRQSVGPTNCVQGKFGLVPVFSCGKATAEGVKSDSIDGNTLFWEKPAGVTLRFRNKGYLFCLGQVLTNTDDDVVNVSLQNTKAVEVC